MKIVRLLLVLLFLSALVGCGSRDTTHEVSMIQLLSNPSQFSDERVAFVGYLDRQGFEIYLTEDHAIARDLNSSFFLDLSPETQGALGDSECRGVYVRVSGRFGLIEKDGGVPELALSDIDLIQSSASRQDCKS